MTRLTHLFTIHRRLDGLQSETAIASDETQTTEKRQSNARKLLILAKSFPIRWNCKYFRTEIRLFL